MSTIKISAYSPLSVVAGTIAGIVREQYPDGKRAIVQLTMTNLRREFDEHTLNESLVARETIITSRQRQAPRSWRWPKTPCVITQKS